MEHIYTVPLLTYVAEKGDNVKVACSASVVLTSRESYDHTYDLTETPPGGETTTRSVTESKTAEHVKEFTVEFDTSTVSSPFTAWEDLTEEQVIEWAKAAKGTDEITALETEGAAIVADKKDRVLNPNRYRYDSPVTPWKVRAEAARAAAEASGPGEVVEVEEETVVETN